MKNSLKKTALTLSILFASAAASAANTDFSWEFDAVVAPQVAPISWEFDSAILEQSSYSWEFDTARLEISDYAWEFEDEVTTPIAAKMAVIAPSEASMSPVSWAFESTPVLKSSGPTWSE